MDRQIADDLHQWTGLRKGTALQRLDPGRVDKGLGVAKRYCRIKVIGNTFIDLGTPACPRTKIRASEAGSSVKVSDAKEIVISAHESAHAVASVRLGLPFHYVTLDDANGPHVEHFENLPRPIGFYRGGLCCGPNQPMCERCRTEEKRAESYILMAMCGSLGAASTGCNAFGFGHEADKAYVIRFCETAFGDQTNACVDARMETMLQRAHQLMLPESKTVTAVSKALRTQRRLTETEVKEIMQD